MTAPDKLLKTTKSFALNTWHALPRGTRNHPLLCKKLEELGYKAVPKATWYRWLDEIETSPVDKIDVAGAIEALSPGVPMKLDIEALKSIPQELVEALGHRVLIIAKGEGLDRVEDAIVKVASAIASKADQIAERLLDAEREKETITKGDNGDLTSKLVEAADAAKNAVNALSICAESMHRITAARVLFSVAYRNFADGDRLSGEGSKLEAEAQSVRDASRADSARDITGSSRTIDAEVEDEAIDAMRDNEARK